MCGIVGVLGNHEVAPLLVEALKRLEYRGYDSAGIATVAGSLGGIGGRASLTSAGALAGSVGCSETNSMATNFEYC